MGWYWIDRQAEWSHVADFTQAWPNLTVLGTEAAEGFEPWSRGPARLVVAAGDVCVRHPARPAERRARVDRLESLLAMTVAELAGNRCDAALLLETNDKYPAIDGDAYTKQPMFYALAHFSAFVPRGSRRVAVESADFGADVPVVAFRTPSWKSCRVPQPRRRRRVLTCATRGAARRCGLRAAARPGDGGVEGVRL